MLLIMRNNRICIPDQRYSQGDAMNTLSAENKYREGLAALSAGRAEEASELFEKAMRAERRHNVTQPQMRYLSYFGLSVPGGLENARPLVRRTYPRRRSLRVERRAGPSGSSVWKIRSRS